MSALARWFRANGHQVSGYDKTETPLTLALTAEGIAIHYADAVENIPAEIRENREKTKTRKKRSDARSISRALRFRDFAFSPFRDYSSHHKRIYSKYQ